jgi:hypothetical protein
MNRTGKLPSPFLLVVIGLLFATPALSSADQANLPETLPDALKGASILDAYIPAEGFDRAGVVHALQGTVVVMHRADRRAFVASKGDPVHENDELFTLGDSRCRIRFLSEDVVNMASNTRFSVEAFKDSPGRGEKTSLFSMLKGKAVFYALRLFRYKQTRFRVKTPTAVVGVRGTRFGVHVFELQGERAEGRGVRVAESGRGMGAHLAQAGSGTGPGTGTIVACGDGQLDVTDPVTGQRIARVNPNEDFNTVTGRKTFDPRNRTLNRMAAEAEVQGEGGEEGGPTGAQETDGPEEAQLDPLAGSEGEPGTSADVMEEVLDTTSFEATEEVAEGGGSISEGKTLGRMYGFTFFIADDAFGTAWYSAGPPEKSPRYESQDAGDGPVYRTGGPEALSGFEDRNSEAGSDFQVILQEQGAPLDKATVTHFGWGTGGDVSLSSPHTFQYVKAGSFQDESGHEYLQWGYWQDTSGTEFGKIGDDGPHSYYTAAGTIWHLEGDQTHPDYIDYLQSQGAQYGYTGEAKGVYVNSAVADVDALSGAFSCDVDFGSREVSNFTINASGGGHNVLISNGSGTIQGSAFDIESYSGNIDGAPLAPGYDPASGAFMGNKAQGVGGMWRAWDGADQWAGGEFHGTR